MSFFLGHSVVPFKPEKDLLRFYEKSKLETLEEKKLPPRSLKIIAEAFAIKGMCFEKIPIQTTSKSKLLDRENKITK